MHHLIGNTPLLCLENKVYAKAEYKNPTGSIKDRAAQFVLQSAREQGLLQPGGTVIEATSGNMGISLAALCQKEGYRCIIVMPDSMSAERQQHMARYGAEVVLTPGALGMQASLAKAAELAAATAGSYLPMQFENPANAQAHVCTTGPEIWAQTQGQIDIFVAGVGTGGTLSGTARFLKSQNPDIRIVAVEPASSPLLSAGQAGSHGIQGIGANFIPAIVDCALIDEVITVSDDDAFQTARSLQNVGISAGANVFAARLLAARHPDKTIVTVLPDSSDRYGSLGL